MSILDTTDQDNMSGLHVQRAWFAHAVLATGEYRYHTGMGPKEIGGHVWQGVSDPFGGQLVSVSAVEEPSFGRAPVVDIVMSGANREFLKLMYDNRHLNEGAPCDLYFATFDAETGEALVGLKKLFPGKLTAMRNPMLGTSVRVIHLRVVSPNEGLNFPTTKSEWSPAAQRRRFPGDEGLDYINAAIIEDYKK